LDELCQSAGLIAQCVRRLPAGPVRLDPPALPDPPAAPDLAARSDPAAFAPAPGSEAYFSVEGPRGEIGFYLVAGNAGAGDSSPPWRCHVRAPSFYNLQALPEMVRGHGVGDLVALLGSLDLALGEVDR
jgi:NADH-quinone oxidoreductase subunit D